MGQVKVPRRISGDKGGRGVGNQRWPGKTEPGKGGTRSIVFKKGDEGLGTSVLYQKQTRARETGNGRFEEKTGRSLLIQRGGVSRGKN